jgi:hypothetical protein
MTPGNVSSPSETLASLLRYPRIRARYAGLESMASSGLGPHEIVVASSGSQKGMSFEKGRIEMDSRCFGLVQVGCK